MNAVSAQLKWFLAVAASAITLASVAAAPAPRTDVDKYGVGFCGSNKWDWIDTVPRLVAHDSAGSCVKVPSRSKAAMTVTEAPNNGSFPNISSGWELGENSCPSASELKQGLCFTYPVKLADDGDPIASVKGATAPGYKGNFAFDAWFAASARGTSFQGRCSAVLGNADTELMVWLSHPGDLQPGTPVGYYETSIGGRPWHVLEWESFNNCPRGEGWRLVIFMAPRVTNGQVAVHGLKLNEFFAYAMRQGWLRSSEYLTAIDLGWEMDHGGKGNSISDYTLSGVR